MALTKKQEELLDKMAQRQGQRLREMLTPKSIATRIYPHLPSANEPKPPAQPKEKT